MRVLVVDDEAPARQRLMDILRKDASVASVLEAADGVAAVTTIERERPDLVFLDVQMPELDGLGVIEAVGPAEMPLTVFVTAYDQHAIRAFEANALDYLLKPYSDERLEATLARVRTRLTETQAGNLLRLVAAPRAARYLDRLVVKSAGVTRFLRVDEIDWIEGAGIYVNLHVAGKSLLYRSALTQLAASLDPERFIRVHRSAIVNIDSIVQLDAVSHGEFDVTLRDGSVARISRTYRALLEQRLGQPL
ncbi:MAG TPA: response regulator [Steroidobacteraceae bacterium]|jgi:two-component system LytT family response regulator